MNMVYFKKKYDSQNLFLDMPMFQLYLPFRSDVYYNQSGKVPLVDTKI